MWPRGKEERRKKSAEREILPLKKGYEVFSRRKCLIDHRLVVGPVFIQDDMV